MPEKTLNILYIAAEADPFVKVGGLGDVAGSLPLALRSLPPEMTGDISLDVRLVLPFHRTIRTESLKLQRELVYSIPRSGGSMPVQISRHTWQGMPVYFVSGVPVSATPLVYSQDPSADGEKYVFFSQASLEMARRLDWRPDIIHANDWHTAPAIYSARMKREHDSFFSKSRMILSVHNLGFMGAGSEAALAAYGLPPQSHEKLPPWAHHQPFPLGLWGADYVAAVSPTYAQEIMTPEFGYGLEDYLQSRRETVTGIINGLDYGMWDPEKDDALAINFNRKNIQKRLGNKAVLQETLGLRIDPDTPILAMVTRMDQQKGVDLVFDALRQVTDLPWQAILLGTGNQELELAARKLEADYPDRVCAVIRYDGKLARLIYGGADILLMPSRYEPCGLAQMIAMRYGCIPLVRATGGLRDTVQEGKTGFLFEEPTSFALAECIRRTIPVYFNTDLWRSIQKRAAGKDFSWMQSALKYFEVYKQLKEL